MTDLINDLFNYTPENSSIRNNKGYQQHREVLLEVRFTRGISFRLYTEWMFSVIGFQNEENPDQAIYMVVKSDGSYEEVHINNKNRITIGGEKYSNWIRYL